MTIDCVQLGTIRGTFWHTIGSRKSVPPMRLRKVPFGDGYMRFSLNSSIRLASGVMPAHLTPTPYCLINVGGPDGDPVVGGLPPAAPLDTASESGERSV